MTVKVSKLLTTKMRANSMAAITISVFNSGQFVEENRRPVRQLPDGRYGVMYGGRVRPLRPNRQIDLADTTYLRDDCRVLSRIPSDLDAKSQQAVQFHSDESGYYTYWMFSGIPEASLKILADAADKEKFSVRSYGRSKRPADNGIQYEWYIQIEHIPSLAHMAPSHYSVSNDEVVARISEEIPDDDEALDASEQFDVDSDLYDFDRSRVAHDVLEDYLSEVSLSNYDDEERNVEIPQHKYADLIKRLDDMSAALTESENHCANQSKIIEEMEQKFSNAEEFYRREIDKRERSRVREQARFEERRREIEEQLIVSDIGQDEQLSTIRAKLRDTQDELDKRETEWCETDEARQEAERKLIEKETEIIDIQAELIKLSQENENLCKENEDLQVQSQDATDREKHGKDLVSRIISVFCPNISLMRDSADVIARVWRTKRSDEVGQDILETLANLQSNEATLKAETVECAPAWKELRFRAHEFNGRMYFMGNHPTRVLISTKVKQKSDFDWLKKNQS